MKFFTEKAESSSKDKVLDVKTLIKLARTYIDSNNTRLAQQCCKKVLRKNSKHYMALVLLGKTYGKTTDASSCYEKAMELKPDHPLAWQGLSQYYEAKDDESAKPKLLSIYDKILTLDIEEDYATKTLRKIGQLGSELKNNDTISSLIHYLKTQNNDNLIKLAKIQLLLLLQSKITCKDEDKEYVIQMLKNLNKKDLSEDHSELILLGELLFQDKYFKHAVEEIIALNIFPQSLKMKAWLCKQIYTTFLTQYSLFGLDLDKYMNVLAYGVEDTKDGCFFIAIKYYTEHMFEEAYRKSYSVIQEHIDVVEETEALFLINCTKMTPNLSRTKDLCSYFLRLEHLRNPTFIVNINAILLSCHIEERHFKKSLYYLKRIPVDQIDSVALYDLGNLFLQQDFIKDKIWKLLNSTEYASIFKALDCIKHKKYSEAVDVLMSYEKHPLKYYFLALSNWFLNLNDESLKYFQKAAELMPDHPKIYYCLGIHYFRRKDDVEQSRKCFEKSYELCKTDLNVVKMLSVIYSKLGLADLEFAFLKQAFKIPETCQFWVCNRLGRLCLTRGIPDEALVYLEAALHIHPQDVESLQLIGHINYNKKEYNRALLAYNKLLELSHSSLVFFKCLNNIGNIYSEKMLYQNAIFVFDSILDNDPCNVAAIKGITENRIIFALRYFANNLFENAREQMQFVIDRLCAAMSQGIKDLAFWVLHGDVLLFLTRLPNEHSFVNVRTPQGEARRDKIDMFKMAINSYCNLMKYRDSSALFKFALAYFELYTETNNMYLLKASYNLAVLYMKLNPTVWTNWDLLSKTCYHLNKYEIAYHCYSKAVSLFENSEIKPWNELGVFYLRLNRQQLDRYRHVIKRYDFAPTWVRENLADAISNHAENPGNNPTVNDEDSEKVQFTEWIRTFQPSSAEPEEPKFEAPIDALRIVPESFEVVEWYLYFDDPTPFTCSSLGKLLERKGLISAALRHYERAYELASGEEKNKMLSHKGRLLMKKQEFAEAIKVYSEVRDKNLHDTTALAQAYCKMNNSRGAHFYYNKALKELCENDHHRISVLVHMSNASYRLHGLHDGAKILLHALDLKFSLDKGINLTYWRTYLFKNVDIPLVAHVMCVFLHKHVEKSLWWYYMGLNYLRGIKKYAKKTRACIKRSIRLNRVTARRGRLYSLMCLTELYIGGWHSSLQHTIRSLRLFPFQPELWAIFILCLYADRTWPHKPVFLRIVIDIVRKFIRRSENMNKWLIKIERDVIGPRWFQSAPAVRPIAQ